MNQSKYDSYNQTIQKVKKDNVWYLPVSKQKSSNYGSGISYSQGGGGGSIKSDDENCNIPDENDSTKNNLKALLLNNEQKISPLLSRMNEIQD